MSQPPNGNPEPENDPHQTHTPPHHPEGQAQQPPSPGEEQGIGIAIHIGGLFTTVIVPLVLWLVYRDRSQFLSEHAKAALNWQILMLAGYIVAGIIVFFPIPFLGSLLQTGIFIIAAIFSVLSAIAANSRQPHRYPLDLKIVT